MVLVDSVTGCGKEPGGMLDDHPPLKRHESLQPFSRDHFLALRVAKHLLQAVNSDVAARLKAREEFLAAWRTEMGSHFNEEEQLLIPLMLSEEMRRMRDDHANIRLLAAQGVSTGSTDDPGVAWCASLGRMLHDHVRWEERSLFGAIQNRAAAEQLEVIGRATAEIERQRPGIRKRGPARNKKST